MHVNLLQLLTQYREIEERSPGNTEHDNERHHHSYHHKNPQVHKSYSKEDVT